MTNSETYVISHIHFKIGSLTSGVANPLVLIYTDLFKMRFQHG